MPDDDLLDTEQAAQYIGMSIPFLKRDRSQYGKHEIKIKRKGRQGKMFYAKEDLDEFIHNRELQMQQKGK